VIVRARASISSAFAALSRSAKRCP
jgi:hypothetical protein